MDECGEGKGRRGKEMSRRMRWMLHKQEAQTCVERRKKRCRIQCHADIRVSARLCVA